MMSLFLYRFPFTLLFLFRCRFRFRFRFLFPFRFLFRIPVSGFSRRPSGSPEVGISEVVLGKISAQPNTFLLWCRHVSALHCMITCYFCEIVHMGCYAKQMWFGRLLVSQWYVYPRTHIPSDKCIPPIWLPVKCVSPTSTPPNKRRFYFCCFVNFVNHRQRDYKWFKITSNTIDKRAMIRDKIIAKLSLASLLLRGPQCWCKHSFSLLSLSNVIIIHMSLVALNKYDWQNFIQQGITRKVKK